MLFKRSTKALRVIEKELDTVSLSKYLIVGDRKSSIEREMAKRVTRFK